MTPGLQKSARKPWYRPESDDQFQVSARAKVYTRRVVLVTDRNVLYENEGGDLVRVTMSQFRRWAKKAEVVMQAPE